MKKWKYKKEWNISYSKHDGYGGKNEFFIILPTWWKVLWWFFRHARSSCEIYVWTTMNGIEGDPLEV